MAKTIWDLYPVSSARFGRDPQKIVMEPPGKLRIYVMGPYTNGVPTTNVHNAIKMGDQLLELDFVPFIPHLTMLWGILSPKPYGEWLDWDMEWLRLCHAAIRLHGFSPGADREEELMDRLGKPTFDTVAELIEWRAARECCS